MSFFAKIRKIQLVTLGTKVLFGVGLVTTLFIGTLVSINLRSARTMEKTVDEVLHTREQLSSNLRQTIVELQNEFLALPDFFETNPQLRILEALAAEYAVAGEQRYSDRAGYASLFSRRERRDISKGGFVVQEEDGRVFVSYGMVGKDGSFTGTVVRLELAAADPQATLAGAGQIIAAIQAQESGPRALAGKVAALGDLVAEAGLKAERSRTEILEHVEDISAKEQLLADIRRQQRDHMISMGIGAVLANMAVLYLLIRLVIERPLRQLTQAIGEIQSGRATEIPLRRRRDQIGVLSGALEKFRQALLEIGRENERKAREKQLIEETVSTTREMIDSIAAEAKELAGLSENLQLLAETAGGQAGNVAHSAAEAAGHTTRVAESSIQLEDVSTDLGRRIESQNHLFGEIVSKNRSSQQHMAELEAAVREIDTIIALVGEITEQTQLLALNATIEAARAGEAGRGFSIVAAEMKELSAKTRQAAAEVMSKVEAINGAGSTLTATFSAIERALEQLDTVTADISAGVVSQRSDIATIRELAARTSDNTGEVSASIGEVNKAAAETSSLSTRVHGFADDIASRMAELSGVTMRLQALAESEEAVPLRGREARQAKRMLTVAPKRATSPDTPSAARKAA